MSLTRSRPAEAVLLPLAGVVIFLGVWQLGVRLSHTSVFPSPLAVARGIAELAGRGLLVGYTLDSLMRVGLGYGLAALIGVPLGMVMGRHAGMREAMNPLVQLLRPISPLAWIPVAVVLFGVGSRAAVFLIFLGSLFPIATSTMNGVARVPLMYLRVGRNLGMSPLQMLRQVVWPAALPEIFTGLRVALGVAWVVVVAAEMIAVDSGLGYLIIDARNAGKRYDLVVAGMLLIGVVGLVLDLGLRRLAVRKWR